MAAPRASSKFPSELTTSPSMYRSQQIFPSTIIRDERSIPAPERGKARVKSSTAILKSGKNLERKVYVSKHNLHSRGKIDLLHFYHPKDSLEEHLTVLLPTHHLLYPIYKPERDMEYQKKNSYFKH